MDSLTATDLRAVGEFRLLARLGSGGMGQVFLGSSLAGRMVAVKVIHRELCQDTEFVRRFRNEVEAAQKVSGWYTAPGRGGGGRRQPAVAGDRVRSRAVTGRHRLPARPAAAAGGVAARRRARRGAARRPRDRARPPRPQARQRAAGDRRSPGHRLRHLPGGHRHPADRHRRHHRNPQLHVPRAGAGARHRARQRHVLARLRPRLRRVRGRPVQRRPGRAVGLGDVPHRARRAQPRRRSRRRPRAHRGVPGQGTAAAARPAPGRGARHGDRGAARAVARRLLAVRRDQGHPGAAGRASAQIEALQVAPGTQVEAAAGRVTGRRGRLRHSARPSASPRLPGPSPDLSLARAGGPRRPPTGPRCLARRPGPLSGHGFTLHGAADGPRHEPPGPAHRGWRGEHRGHRRRGLGWALSSRSAGGTPSLGTGNTSLPADSGSRPGARRCSSTTARARAGRRPGTSPRATPSRPTPVPGTAWCTSRSTDNNVYAVNIASTGGTPGRSSRERSPLPRRSSATWSAWPPARVTSTPCARPTASPPGTWTQRTSDLQAHLGGRRRQRHRRHGHTSPRAYDAATGGKA